MVHHRSVRVWDIAIRFFHWSLVAAFVLVYATGEHFESLHKTIGYCIIGLLAFRMLWGFIGSKHARFTDFIYAPSTIRAYLNSLLTGRPKHYVGHNPAGGAMVIVMLIMLSLVSWSGIQAEEAENAIAGNPAIQLVTPAHADDFEWDEHGENEGNEFWEEVHEAMVNLMILLIFIHLGGVFISSILHRENLIRAMITGKKEIPEE